ncbi:MAG: hypothetical protein HIU83_05785 [Proteobacteria bacterium]|nr:hypothetical protein [Pseudomonadota bacterium]
MYMPLPSRLFLPLAALFLLSWSTSVLAAATVTVTPSGDSSYSVLGAGMDGVAGIQLDIFYDAASLATPTVTQGGLVSGAMLAANTSQTGHIKIAIISTRVFSGSGQIATLSFASKTGSGGITSVTTSMIDSKGAVVSASAVITGGSESNIPGLSSTPGVPFSQSSQATQASQSSQSDTATIPAYLGTVTMPSEQHRDPSPPETPSSSPGDTGEPAPRAAEKTQPPDIPVADTKPEETSQYVVYGGILDRFKQYNGSKKFSAMKTLFDMDVAQAIRQEPALLVSDGQSKATLTVDIPARSNSSPNFAVKGGTLVSFKRDTQGKDRWIVDVLPKSGVTVVTLTILSGADVHEFPLTVVPPVKTALTFDERGWDRFLKEVGTAKAPLHDLNNDGVRDYMDEFIFVAHSLLNKTVTSKP